MKTMKNTIFSLFLAILTSLFTSCNEKAGVSTGSVNDSISVQINQNIDAVPVPASTDSKEKSIDFSNPAFFGGSDFGSYIRVLYIQGKYDEIVNLTSKSTIEKFGRENLKEFYKRMHFGYELKLNSQTTNKQDSIIILNYETNIVATKRVIRIHTKVENDTVRIVLNNIKTKNPFDTQD